MAGGRSDTEIVGTPKRAPVLWLRRATLVLLAGAIVAALVYLRPYFRPETLQESVERWGAFGPAAFIVFYIAATVLMLPGSSLTLAGGFLFGPLWGTAFSLTGATIGAMLAFLAARYLVGSRVSRKLSEKLPTIQQSIEQDGWKYVAVARLIPIFPFNLLNYAFGLTSVAFVPYALATFVCMMPGAFAYTYLGYAARTVVGGMGQSTSVKQVALVVSTALGLLVLLWAIQRAWARRAVSPPHPKEFR